MTDDSFTVVCKCWYGYKHRSQKAEWCLHKMYLYTIMLKKTLLLTPPKKYKTDQLSPHSVARCMRLHCRPQSHLNLNFDVVWHSVIWRRSWLICNGIAANSSKKERRKRWFCQRSEETYKYQRTEARAREQDAALHTGVSLMIANPIVSLLNMLKEIKDFTPVFRVWR